jgi:uncharacterized membrane protein
LAKPNIYVAFLAYLLNTLGWLFVFLFYRQDKFALYHAKQSLGLTLAAIGGPILWIVIGWLISWIPYVGFVLAISLFSLLMALYAVLVIAWIMGMAHALQAKRQPVPLVGRWAERLPIG